MPAWRLGASLAAAVVALLFLSAGEFGDLAPYTLARKLPLFSSFNVPSRYTVAVPMFCRSLDSSRTHSRATSG